MLIYTKEYTIFNLKSPYIDNLKLVLFDKDENKILEQDMIKINDNFSLEIKGDLEGKLYKFKHNDKEFLDPYAKSCSVNSKYSVIIDDKKIKMEKIETTSEDDIIIYELSIRDFTYNSKKRGKYLGVVEKENIDYLKKLGVTHVQILPFFDFSSESVDDINQFDRYNWGYDPVNYNIPEGSYSENPRDPYSRILELKTMINELHKNNIKVIMDVVYNHLYKIDNHYFWEAFKKEGIRFFDDKISNGSGCGNDIKSENPYIREYIVNSVLYWLREFDLDGFRFDLMGLLDLETMNIIRKKVDEVKDNILIYGEGWSLNTASNVELATQNNAYKMNNIGFFSDDTRNFIRGNVFSHEKGFMQGAGYEWQIVNVLKGNQNFKSYISPNQIINYVEAHDDHTLFDFITYLDNSVDYESKKRMSKLATSIILLSQGIPFIHAGQEFYRSKNGISNTYKSDDEINKWDINQARKYEKDVKYISDLIKFRKESKLFKYATYDEINKNIHILKSEYSEIIFKIEDYLFILKNNQNNMNLKQYLENNNIVTENGCDLIFNDFSKNINLNYEEYNLKNIDVVILKIR